MSKAMILALCAVFVLSGCAEKAQPAIEPVSKTVDGPLDTVSTITIYSGKGAKSPEEAIDAAFALVRETDELMSAMSDEGDVAAINALSGSGAAAVSGRTYELVRSAMEIGMDTGGAFDITIKPVVDLWEIGSGGGRVPSDAEIREALELVDCSAIKTDDKLQSVMLTRPGAKIDLGGIAKGAACDYAADSLRSDRVKSAIIDLGGNIYALGKRMDGSPWRVGVKLPIPGENGYLGVIEVEDSSVVTSGVYERYFEQDGVIYHHIMDPETGAPARTGLLSVTIVCRSSTLADALSTACFVMGAERGMEYLSGVDGAEGVFVTEDNGVLVTPGLRDVFSVTDGRFTLRDSG